MGLAVETPTPPDLTNRPMPSALEPTEASDDIGDLRREELEEVLLDGAWNDAFGEWAEYTDLTEAEYRTLHDAGVVEELDFYWDPADGRIRFEVPSIPEEATGEDDFAARATAELTELCRTVVETLEGAYVDWSDEEAGEKAWSEETLSGETTLDDR